MSFVTLAVIGGVAGLAGAGIQASAASSAANQQRRGLEESLSLQQHMYDTTRADESQFLQGGQSASKELNYLLGYGKPGDMNTAEGSASGGFGSLNAPFTADTFKQYSPAYQFNMQQGQQGVLNQNSGGQGALSGSALKDLMSFNQGYANNSFQNAFNQYTTQQNNTFSRLYNIAGLGSQAGSAGTTGAPQFAASMGQTAGAMGAATAAGTIGAGNAWSGGVSNIGDSYLTSQYLTAMQKKNNSLSGDAGIGLT